MISKKYIIIFLILSLSLILNLTDAARPAFAVTISATANWGGEPGTATYPNTVLNGDFTIWSFDQTIAGDGINDVTEWTFDFTSDPNYAAFLTIGPLTSAIITMTLIPKEAAGFPTDQVKLWPYNPININPSGWAIDQEFSFVNGNPKMTPCGNRKGTPPLVW